MATVLAVAMTLSCSGEQVRQSFLSFYEKTTMSVVGNVTQGQLSNVVVQVKRGPYPYQEELVDEKIQSEPDTVTPKFNYKDDYKEVEDTIHVTRLDLVPGGKSSIWVSIPSVENYYPQQEKLNCQISNQSN